MGAETAVLALENRFLRDYPREAARRLEALPAEEAAQVIEGQPTGVIIPVWEQLASYVQERFARRFPPPLVGRLLTEMDPPLAAELLLAFDAAERGAWLARMEPAAAKLVESLMAYPPDTAGRLMDPRVVSFRPEMTAAEAIGRMKAFKKNRSLRDLFLVDGENRLAGRIEIQDLATAPGDARLAALARPLVVAVLDTAPKEEVVEKIERHRVSALPVVSVSERLLGVIHPSALLAAVQEEATLDIQTMVGASRDERALSRVAFVVRRRLPWLQINLVTAALAASVVGFFESTIAQVTALAVLMPVVAGQAGNTGQQALAVTMRALALREITARQLPRVAAKELIAALLNGLAVAAVAALVVYLWSGSGGLALVIGIAIVVSMMIAGLSGALIPITLARLGFDPAQASSIFLTTVTDVMGFFSFLGIAVLLQAWL
jgi:magnesium transporter